MSESSYQNLLVDGDNPESEAQIIASAQNNPACFQALYDRWVLPIYQYIYFQTGNVPDAEDLTSQVFLAAYQALPRYHHNGHFAGWLFTIARNQTREFFRKRKREVPLEMANHAAARTDLMETIDHQEEINRLHTAVRNLAEEEQELIRLRYIAQLSFAEIATMLKRKEDAVKKSLYRLQGRLEGLLEVDHD
jgi:RNA polymerase sigma-70 factor, ECF subfamily